MRYQRVALWILGSLFAPLWSCSAIIDTEDYVFCEEGDRACEGCQEFNNALEGEWASGCFFEESFNQELIYSFELNDDCEGVLTVDRVYYYARDDERLCETPVWVEQQRFDYLVDDDSLDADAVRLNLTVDENSFVFIHETGVERANEDPPFLGIDDWKLNEWMSLLDMVVDTDLDESPYRIFHRGDPGFLGVVPHMDGTYRFSPAVEKQGDAAMTYDYEFNMVSGSSAEEQFF